MTEQERWTTKIVSSFLTGGISGESQRWELTGFFVYADAYVHAYTVTVAPYVAGYIKNIHIQPNQFVKKGADL